MIIFYSDGRLGNQLFQLAFLQKISRPKETILTFNLGKVFEVFDININVSNFEIKGKLFRSFFWRLFIYFFETLSSLRVISTIYENLEEVKYYKERGLFQSFIYVRTGFFQSEKFFNVEYFFNNIKIKDVYLEKAKNILINIPRTFTKVFIHVRRGDYLNENYLGIQGIDLPLNYYNIAISLIIKKIPNPYFIILSDDFSFTNISFIKLENKIFSRNDSEVDLAIMTLCQCGVISNSSFSWWGGFLMKEKEIVIMPKYWYGWKSKVQSHKGINLSSALVLDF